MNKITDELPLPVLIPEPLTVRDAYRLKLELELEIARLIKEFEEDTQTDVLHIMIERGDGCQVASVDVVAKL